MRRSRTYYQDHPVPRRYAAVPTRRPLPLYAAQPPEPEAQTFGMDFMVTFVMMAMMVGLMGTLAEETSAAVIEAQFRVPVLTEGPAPMADAVGIAWLEPAPAGQPSRAWIIMENRAGGFEPVQWGIST